MNVGVDNVSRHTKLRLHVRPSPTLASIALIGVLYFVLSWCYLANRLHIDLIDKGRDSVIVNESDYRNLHWIPGLIRTKDHHPLPKSVPQWPVTGPPVRRKLITAYLEPPINTTVEPLPLRTQTPSELVQVVYPRVQSCHDIPSKLPVDRGVQYGADGEPLVTNVGDQETPPNFLREQTPFCPVDADPFLPWIHDIFVQGRKVHIIAQNKRRCQTGPKHRADQERMEPQVALMQSVSVQHITPAQAIQLAPELWNGPSSPTSNTKPAPALRYRLAPFHQADTNYTRFICRFHSYSPTGRRQELGETLSQYPFSYELVAFRKRNSQGGLLSKVNRDNAKFWTSTLLFYCPLPHTIQTTNDTDNDDAIWMTKDGIPLMHVDIIPIRTPARFPLSLKDDGYYLSEEQIGPDAAARLLFQPQKAWGEKHVLPLPEASGRWENLPLCPVSSSPSTTTTTTPTTTTTTSKNINSDKNSSRGSTNEKKKPHLLSVCLWSAASFRTRGKHDFKHSIDDTITRLREWIEFHLLVGVDHIYVYDNSGAFGNSTNSLRPVVNLFPSSQVTWIDWPMQVCNNNVPAHENIGERSSQYAAENSCRERYGPRTEWMASIDTDEYLVPQGSHTSLRTVLEQATDTNILSFPSSRGKLRHLYSESNHHGGRMKMTNVTFLQAFNCDGSPTPRPDWADRARKQVYRPSYVWNHFVHYSTVTKALATTYAETRPYNYNWTRYFHEGPPSERRVDELNEAMMIHSKSLDKSQTNLWETRCRYDFPKKHLGCSVGFPWPDGVSQHDNSVNDHQDHSSQEQEQQDYDPLTGWKYNCHVNRRVDEYWIPRLETAIQKRQRRFQERGSET